MTQLKQSLDELFESIADQREPLKEPIVGKNVNPYASPAPNAQLEIIENALTRARELFKAKNDEYAGSSSDILGNFRRQAGQLHVPMSTVWMVLAGKHIDAIQEYVKDCKGDVLRPRTQPVSERVDDLIVYALLLQVILAEEGHP